jgi:uncharacterized protein (TIGR02118 family)
VVKLVALYAHPADPAAFDQHYRQTHIPLVQTLPGLRRLEAARVVGAPGGVPPPYYLIAEMYFDDLDALRAALRSPPGRAAADDLQRFAPGLVTLLYAQVD